jgi:hypothetical protein
LYCVWGCARMGVNCPHTRQFVLDVATDCVLADARSLGEILDTAVSVIRRLLKNISVNHRVNESVNQRYIEQMILGFSESWRTAE